MIVPDLLRQPGSREHSTQKSCPCLALSFLPVYHRHTSTASPTAPPTPFTPHIPPTQAGRPPGPSPGQSLECGGRMPLGEQEGRPKPPCSSARGVRMWLGSCGNLSRSMMNVSSLMQPHSSFPPHRSLPIPWPPRLSIPLHTSPYIRLQRFASLALRMWHAWSQYKHGMRSALQRALTERDSRAIGIALATWREVARHQRWRASVLRQVAETFQLRVLKVRHGGLMGIVWISGGSY